MSQAPITKAASGPSSLIASAFLANPAHLQL